MKLRMPLVVNLFQRPNFSLCSDLRDATSSQTASVTSHLPVDRPSSFVRLLASCTMCRSTKLSHTYTKCRFVRVASLLKESTSKSASIPRFFTSVLNQRHCKLVWFASALWSSPASCNSKPCHFTPRHSKPSYLSEVNWISLSNRIAFNQVGLAKQIKARFRNLLRSFSQMNVSRQASTLDVSGSGKYAPPPVSDSDVKLMQPFNSENEGIPIRLSLSSVSNSPWQLNAWSNAGSQAWERLVVNDASDCGRNPLRKAIESCPWVGKSLFFLWRDISIVTHRRIWSKTDEFLCRCSPLNEGQCVWMRLPCSFLTTPTHGSKIFSRGNRRIHRESSSLDTVRDVSVSWIVKKRAGKYHPRWELPGAGFASL